MQLTVTSNEQLTVTFNVQVTVTADVQVTVTANVQLTGMPTTVVTRNLNSSLIDIKRNISGQQSQPCRRSEFHDVADSKAIHRAPDLCNGEQSSSRDWSPIGLNSRHRNSYLEPIISFPWVHSAALLSLFGSSLYQPKDS